MKKLIASSLGILIGVAAFGQTSTAVKLNWKINPDETLTYQTIMNEIDPSKDDDNFKDLLKAIEDTSANKINKIRDLINQRNLSAKQGDLASGLPNTGLETELTNSGNGTVNIVMKPGSADAGNNEKTMLSGSIYETGGIHSFWISASQKNLMAMFFELPNKPVKVGDSWEIDVNLTIKDQYFECDSAYKINKVTLTDLQNRDGETIAVIQYEIEEFVAGVSTNPIMIKEGESNQTMTKYKLQTIAEFSVDKGRWVSYDGILEFEAIGAITAHSKKKFSLIEEQKGSK
ncbi:hypothetical protein ACFLR1_01645 [Bacteroidota bacterium]